MPDVNFDTDVAYIKGKSVPIIRKFEIEGLYGYRNLSLETKFMSTIVIAGNGSGKTTLLSVMSAVLKKQFTRLRDLDFRRINCLFEGSLFPSIITRSDIDQFCSQQTQKPIRQYASRLQLQTSVLFTYLMEEFDVQVDMTEYYNHPVLKTLVAAEGYTTAKVNRACLRLRDELLSMVENLQKFTIDIDRYVGETEIVYLPTYRRIETALIQEEDKPGFGANKKPKMQFRTSSLYNLDIQFGLSDIVQRLAEMNVTVTGRSNQAYSRITTNIISDFLDGTFDRTEYKQIDIPPKEEMKLFLDRIEAAQHFGRQRRTEVPSLDKFYSEDNERDRNSKFLLYFLSQLGNVLEETKQIETDIEDFIKGCNKYLSLEGLSTQPTQELFAKDRSFEDSKKMFLNRKDLTIEVHGIKDRPISLETLSSGEKQLVSILAKLYLYSKDKIVLIDEPELSLSMDWQRQILVDVLTAPRCKQLIAITHSPFIFDNSLEPFARSLEVTFTD